MTSPREQELYFEARNRAMERIADDRMSDSNRWFINGSSYALGFDHFSEETIIKNVKSETNEAFALVCGLLSKVEAVKGKGYLASWQKRGLAEAHKAHLSRKFDRIDAILVGGAEEGGESLTSNLGDLAVYAIKMIAFRAELKPEEFRAWLVEVRNLR
jgi:hypothetical protein